MRMKYYIGGCEVEKEWAEKWARKFYGCSYADVVKMNKEKEEDRIRLGNDNCIVCGKEYQRKTKKHNCCNKKCGKDFALIMKAFRLLRLSPHPMLLRDIAIRKINT